MDDPNPLRPFFNGIIVGLWLGALLAFLLMSNCSPQPVGAL